MEPINNWVWTKQTEDKYPERKAGTPVDTAYLRRGDKEWTPPFSWVLKNYVRNVEDYLNYVESGINCPKCGSDADLYVGQDGGRQVEITACSNSNCDYMHTENDRRKFVYKVK